MSVHVSCPYLMSTQAHWGHLLPDADMCHTRQTLALLMGHKKWEANVIQQEAASTTYS